MDALIDKNMQLESRNAKLEREVQEWCSQEGKRYAEAARLRAMLQTRNLGGGFTPNGFSARD